MTIRNQTINSFKSKGVNLTDATDEEIVIYLQSIKLGGIATLYNTLRSYESSTL